MGPPEVGYQQRLDEEQSLDVELLKKNDAAGESFTFADTDSNTNSRPVLSQN